MVEQNIISHLVFFLTRTHSRAHRFFSGKGEEGLDCVRLSVGNIFQTKHVLKNCLRNLSESRRRADDCSFVRSVMSFCVDGVVKAHDAFSPSHWTDYSITFRIDYSPTAGSRVIRFSKASSERAIQRTHSEVENKKLPKTFQIQQQIKIGHV